MNNIALIQWNRLKEEIESLKSYGADPTVVAKIRILKDRASVLRFAMEEARMGHPPEEIERRRINRNL